MRNLVNLSFAITSDLEALFPAIALLPFSYIRLLLKRFVLYIYKKKTGKLLKIMNVVNRQQETSYLVLVSSK